MKRFLATILAVLYLATSTGATINIHYCMGEMYSVDLNHSENCGKCGMEKGVGDCCKDEAKLLKVTDSHQLIQHDFSFHPLSVAVTRYDISSRFIMLSKADKVSVRNNSPPAVTTPLCILHSVFRI